MASRASVQARGNYKPRPILDALLARRWAAYDRLPEHEQAAVDARRLIPVPETRALLAWWRTSSEECRPAA